MRLYIQNPYHMNLDQETFVNPYTDYGFKRLFGRDENKDLLISFLNAVFDGKRSPVTDVRYLNTEMLGEYRGDRGSVFDVYCIQEDGARYIVEMQKSDQYYFKDRSVFYAAGAIREQAPQGDWDYHLNEVVVVGLLNFEFPNREYPKESFFHEAQILDRKDHHVVYDKLTFYYLEMPKFKKREDELETMMDRWMYAFTRLCYLQERPAVLDDAVFVKFFEEARIANYGRLDRMFYEESRKNKWDMFSSLETSHGKGVEEGIKKGIKEGIKEGVEIGRLDVARKMREAGLDDEAIAQLSGLPIEMIKSL